MARILVVDDEPDMLFLLKVVLQGAGHEVDEALHGAEALARVKVRLPEAIVTDLMMPVMDGDELIATLRSDPATSGIPILLLTAIPQQQSAADFVMTKPFTHAQLLETIDSMLSA